MRTSIFGVLFFLLKSNHETIELKNILWLVHLHAKLQTFKLLFYSGKGKHGFMAKMFMAKVP